MTKEEAIWYLAPIAESASLERYKEALGLAFAALRAQQEAEKNDPLTLDELREMDGEPVWVEQPSDTLLPFWGLVNVEDEAISGNLYCAVFEDYDTEWLAYRRKPEEE